MRRANPDAEGQAEEPVHLLFAQRVHLLRERKTPRSIPVGHRPGEGLRRRLEWARPDEAVDARQSADRLASVSANSRPVRKARLSSIISKNHDISFHRLAPPLPSLEHADRIPQDPL